MTIATGGTITYTDSDGLNPRAEPYAGGYKVHTFTTVETTSLVVTTGGDVDYLVVAGGGGGGGKAGTTGSGEYYGGGGGAGGVRTGTLTLTTGSKTVTVGAGGVANTGATWAGNGEDSVLDSITAKGGGGGAVSVTGKTNGVIGGSGGGGAAASGVGGDSDLYSPKQGYDGGAAAGSADYGSGGGGGATAVGGAGTTTAGGAGGAATTNSISGTATVYAGGGGGSVRRDTTVASGGGYGGTVVGGNGGDSNTDATSGAINTGSGGGGSSNTAGGGGAGGSGIVIVRYLYSDFLSVSTQAATSVTGTTCTGNGTIVSVLQDHTVNVRGFCWVTGGGDPTVSDSHAEDSAGGYTAGAYTKSITGLSAGTAYKMRAYCTDDHSTEYGDSVTVTTLGTVSTVTPTSVSWNLMMGNGNVTSIGASALTAKGVCYKAGTSGDPTTADSTSATTGSATGTYTVPITGLTKATSYRVRAYATNTEGTFYGVSETATTDARETANVERMIELDFMEYPTDALAQAEYVSSLAAALQCFSEATIKTEGGHSLKISAGSGGGVTLTQTGGTVTYTDADGLNPRSSPAYDGGYTVITFLESGHIDVSTGGDIQYLVVAGGGGAGNASYSGGGGGGGVRTGTLTVTTGEKLVTIGGGGAENTNGGDSVFITITSTGGGAGGGSVDGHGEIGSDGGSGGGGSGNSGTYAGGDSDYLSPKQGYDGGTGSYTSGPPANYGGGGGGGASAIGGSYSSTGVGANGGEGISSSFSGVATIYSSGGGGGGSITGGTGGTGAGNGSNSGAGAAATGYGCGGGGCAGSGAGGAGHEGIVILRYQSSALGQTLTRTLSGTEEICNLSYVDSISFDMRASRTGANLKITLHDTSADTEITPTIAVADTWQTVTWDLSAVANANKDDIHQIKFTVMDASDSTIYYLDNFKCVGSAGTASNIFGWT